MTPTPTAIEPGFVLPTLTTRLSRTDLVRYAGASGDFNPIHHSPFFADQVGLPGVIAHGMLTMATALRVVTDWAGGPAAVRTYFVRFTKPVVVADDGLGTELVISATVSAVEDGIATINIEVIAPDQGDRGEKVLGMATAEVDLALVSSGGSERR